eukprot:gene44649-60466_t
MEEVTDTYLEAHLEELIERVREDRLNPQNAKIFRFFNSIFSPMLNFFRGMAKPYQVGIGVAIDTAQFI